MADWHPTAYRTHTLGEIQDKGADLVQGTEVTVCGFMEANRGKGAICFVDSSRRYWETPGLPQRRYHWRGES